MRTRQASNPSFSASIVILCTPCSKGSQGLRAGVHLVNHGATVIAFLPSSYTQLSPSFEFHLRLFSSSGGKVIRFDDDLPENADLIIDAVLDNDIGTKKSKYDSSVAEAVFWAETCTPARRKATSPIISIDLPSNTDPDTGECFRGATWSITPTSVISLGLVKAASVIGRYSLFLVDIGLPLVGSPPFDHEVRAAHEDYLQIAVERAGVKDYKRPFIGDTWAREYSHLW